MIAGIGVDSVEIKRVEAAIARPRFLARVYTEAERAYITKSGGRENSAAGMFAAKEAVAKALGTGFSGGVWLSDIEVLRSERGAPRIALYGGALAALPTGARVHVSITHDRERAMAFAIVECGGTA